KKGTIIGLIDKVFCRSHPKFHKENLEFIVDILLNNGYPFSLFFNTIADRLNILFHRFNNKHDNVLNDDESVIDDERDGSKIAYFNVPYMRNISERIRYCVRDLGVRLSYTGINNLHRFIKVGKDGLQKDLRSNIVYKINCTDCDASYVGQTGRLLRTRIKEHRLMAEN
ncbi:hypothetical protein EAG_07008, partial [Camponotus floridanus]